MPTTLTFRHATPGDIPALVTLVTSAYRGEASRAGWTSEADLLDGSRIVPEVLEDDIHRPGSQVLIAERRLTPDDAGDNSASAATAVELVACAHLDQVDGAGCFGMFAVRPDRQGNGIGDAVLKEAERFAAASGLSRMRMTVIDIRHELMSWYERRGYQTTGEQQPFPYGDSRFGDPKRHDLRFAVLEKTLTS